MKLKLMILSEENLRRMVIKHNALYENRRLLYMIVDNVYGGRLTNLLYNLITNHSDCYTTVDTCSLHDGYIEGDVRQFMRVVSKFNMNYIDRKFIIKNNLSKGDCDIPYLGEFSRISYAVNVSDDYEYNVEIHDLIFTFLNAFHSHILDKFIDNDEYTVINVTNKFDNLELVLQ